MKTFRYFIAIVWLGLLAFNVWAVVTNSNIINGIMVPVSIGAVIWYLLAAIQTESSNESR
jgi:hypothetical protein